MSELKEYKPSDVLTMVKEIIEYDINHTDNPIFIYHYICHMIDFITPKFHKDDGNDGGINTVYNKCANVLGTKFYEYMDWMLNTDDISTFWRNLRNSLLNNKPSETLFPEIYHHPSYVKDMKSHAWWSRKKLNDIDYSRIVLPQKVKYLELLISKLKENGQ